MPRKGFTLIELLVVIAIIGLLSTLAIVALGTARVKSRDARRVADLKQIQTALELYASDNAGAYPPTTSIQIGDTSHACLNNLGFQSTGCTGTVYIASLPKDPKGGYYFYTGTGNDYSVAASLEGNINSLTGPISISPNSGIAASTLIPDDAATVAHVYWNGSALVDTKSNAWIMNGTVPQGTYPRSRGSAGPFSASNYYKLGSGSDPLDLTTYTGRVVFSCAAPADSYFAGNGLWHSAGWYLRIVGGHVYHSIETAGAGNDIGSPNLVGAGINVASFGYSGGTGYVMLNGIQSSGSGSISQDASRVMALGADVGGASATPCTIYEFMMTSVGYDSTTENAIQQRVLGLLQ